MDAAQAALEPLGEIIVVELVVAEAAKGRRVSMRAAPGPADGVTPRAQGLEQGLSSLLTILHRVAGRGEGASQQQCEAKSAHGNCSPLPEQQSMAG
jgi:hypothetical protein